MRNTGRTKDFIFEMKKKLEENKTFGLVGCKDPYYVLGLLDKEGIKATAKPMTHTLPPETVCDDYGPTSLKYFNPITTGYIFSIIPSESKFAKHGREKEEECLNQISKIKCKSEFHENDLRFQGHCETCGERR